MEIKKIDKFVVLAIIVLIFGVTLTATYGSGEITDKKEDRHGYYIEIDNEYWEQVDGDEYYNLKVGDNLINEKGSAIIFATVLGIMMLFIISLMEDSRKYRRY